MSTPLSLSNDRSATWLTAPLQLLLRLREAMARLAASKEESDGFLKEISSHVQQSLTETLATLPFFDEFWGWYCRVVLAGCADIVHAQRSEILGTLKGHVTSLEKDVEMALVVGSAIPEVEQFVEHFEAEVAKFDRKVDQISSRWKTAEDLEELAAESVDSSQEMAAAVRTDWMRLMGLPQEEIAELCRLDSEQHFNLVDEVRELRAALRLKKTGPTYNELLSWAHGVVG